MSGYRPLGCDEQGRYPPARDHIDAGCKPSPVGLHAWEVEGALWQCMHCKATRRPQAAEPCIDEDELGVKLPEPEPWWPYVLGAVVGLLVFALLFAPLGGKP